MKTKLRILLVEDDALFVSMLVRVLAPHYDIVKASTAELALDLILSGEQFDIVLSDMCLEGWSGGDLYQRLRRRGDPHASVFVMLSGVDVGQQCPAVAANLGARLLSKPVGSVALLAALAAVPARIAAA